MSPAERREAIETMRVPLAITVGMFGLSALFLVMAALVG